MVRMAGRPTGRGAGGGGLEAAGGAGPWVSIMEEGAAAPCTVAAACTAAAAVSRIKLLLLGDLSPSKARGDPGLVRGDPGLVGGDPGLVDPPETLPPVVAPPPAHAPDDDGVPGSITCNVENKQLEQLQTSP